MPAGVTVALLLAVDLSELNDEADVLERTVMRGAPLEDVDELEETVLPDPLPAAAEPFDFVPTSLLSAETIRFRLGMDRTGCGSGPFVLLLTTPLLIAVLLSDEGPTVRPATETCEAELLAVEAMDSAGLDRPELLVVRLLVDADGLSDLPGPRSGEARNNGLPPWLGPLTDRGWLVSAACKLPRCSEGVCWPDRPNDPDCPPRLETPSFGDATVLEVLETLLAEVDPVDPELNGRSLGFILAARRGVAETRRAGTPRCVFALSDA